MTLPENYRRVLNLIKVGADNPITGAEISLILKLEERSVQSIISSLITRYNIPIIGIRHGFNRGYFIPANKEELLDGAKAFYNQVQKEQERLSVLLNADLTSYKELLKGSLFSQDYEAKLLEQNLTAFNRFLEAYQKPKPRVLGLITAEQVKEELNIKGKTLKRWENAGLRRYQPPLEDTRKHYYKVSDILIFLGVNV